MATRTETSRKLSRRAFFWLIALSPLFAPTRGHKQKPKREARTIIWIGHI